MPHVPARPLAAGSAPPAPGQRPARLLSLVPAPDPDPAPGAPVAVRQPPVQATLPLEWRLPSGLPADPPHELADVRTIDAASTAEPLPPPAAWAARLARVVLEVVSGERPAGQLRRWTTRAVQDELATRARGTVGRHAAPTVAPTFRRVSSVRICALAGDVVEACAVVSGGSRARAVALRLEGVGGRWIATAVEVG